MTPEAWGFFTVLTTTSAGTLVELIRTRKRVEKTATTHQLTETTDAATAAAQEAARAVRAQPTSNGFVDRVLGSLHKLEEGQAQIRGDLGQVRQRLDRHIDDHASADVNDR